MADAHSMVNWPINQTFRFRCDGPQFALDKGHAICPDLCLHLACWAVVLHQASLSEQLLSSLFAKLTRGSTIRF